MSKTKRRKNLKGKLIGCLCLAVIAAGMTTVPVIPCISGVGVINASAETADAVAVDLSKIVEYKDDTTACPTGVTAVFANNNNTIELTLDNGSYKFSGKNCINDAYVDVKIIVPSGKNVQIEFDNAAIINNYGEYADTNIFYILHYSPYSVNYLDDNNERACRIYDYAVPFKVEGTLTVSGSLSVDTYSYCNDPQRCSYEEKHGASADLYEGGGSFNKGDFLTIKYVDEDGIVIDRKYYLNGDESKADAGYSCLTDPDADNVITARKDHTLSYHDAVPHTCTTDGNVEYWDCSVCGKKFSDDNGTTEITNIVDPAKHSLTHHDAVPHTCTTDGNVEYWDCSVCGNKFSDADGKTGTDDIVDPAPGHNWDTAYESNETHHWHNCTNANCPITEDDQKDGYAVHTPGAAATETTPQTCTDCGYVLASALGHIHTHSLSKDYSKDETGHWHTCSGCDEKVDFEAHIENSGTVTVQPTAYTTGVRVYSCSVCGYVLRTETIPATGMPSHPTYPTYPTYTTYPVVSTPSVFTEKLTVKAELDGGTATLSWDKVENADKYYVYQYKDGKYVEIKTTTDTSVMLKGLKNGETYKFLVRYSIGGKLSPMTYSDKITVKVYYKPIAKATSTENSIKLTWRAVPNAEKYAVYKYVDGKAVKLCETEKLAVRINKLTPDTKYQYIVRAYVDGKWTSMKKSDIVTFKTKAE